ncbi:helix-turn-helix transcriptional regulator [Microbulbifer sp. SSSA007]|uniref:helix-turn-helix transcriptional regulator n=1 Tax=unclassified Microbulbifer TaxID=2619833 RepID=UPI0040399B01
MTQNLTPGQVIHRARKSKKMSQERLGKLLGLERGAIRDLERGKKNSLTFQQFSTLYREFSITPNDILGIHSDVDTSDEEALSLAIGRAAPEISTLILKKLHARKIK